MEIASPAEDLTTEVPIAPAPEGRRRAADLVTWFDAHRSAVLASVSVYLALVAVAPITMTPFRSDDAINKGTRAILQHEEGSFLTALLREIHHFTTQWMANEGRFFPGSITWSFSVFSIFTSRGAYKLFAAVLCLVMIALVAHLASTLTRSRWMPVVIVAVMCCTLTLRGWHDGLDSFAGLLALTISLAVGATILLIRGTSRWSIALAIILWSIALVTYEVVIVVTPVVCLVIWWSRRSGPRALALLWPTLVDGLFVLYLRAHATSVAPGYSVSLDPALVAATYVQQTAAALPLSEQWYPGSADFVVPHQLIGMTLLLVGVPTALGLVAALRSGPFPTWRSILMLAFVGASFWLLPAVLIAITARWQAELPDGQGYLSVVWGYVGVALLMAAGWVTAAKRHVERPGVVGRVMVISATLVLSVMAALTVAQSRSIAELLVFGIE